MKKQKLTLKSVKNVLSRAEMRKIMAGSGSTCQNECGGTLGGCPSGETCASIYCPDDPAFTHAVCI